MKKLLTISVVLSSLLNAFSPFDKVNTNDNQINRTTNLVQASNTINNSNRYKTTLERVEILENELNKLKSHINDNEEYTEEVEGNLDDLTTKVLKNNRIGFTRLKFDSTVHNFIYTTADGVKHTNKNVATSNLKMDLETKISSKLTFRGQLAMYKFWAQGNNYPYSNYDNMEGRVPSNSSLYVTRAYIDWKAISGNIPVTFTIGRQPSSSGPSWQYSNNGVRYGTYDALVFDGNADGIVATIGIKTSSIRLAYGKGYQNNTFSTSQSGVKDNNVLGLFIDNKIPTIKNSFLQLYATIAKDISTGNANLGDISWFGGMFELNNISNFDFFAHYSISKTSPNGTLTTMEDGSKMGLLTNINGDTSTKTGQAFWIGTRYSFQSKAKLGLEYGKGSQNWINMTQGSDNILNPRSTRGTVIDIYGIYPIDKSIGVNAFIKVGSTMIDYDYSGSGMPYGTPMKISDNMGGYETKITDKINNFYVDFQVNY